MIVNRALGRSPDEDRLLDEDEMITWPDNNPEDWFYADMQEATNSHDYTWVTVSGDKVEKWTEKLEQRDWAALEHAWSTAHSAPGGEVTSKRVLWQNLIPQRPWERHLPLPRPLTASDGASGLFVASGRAGDIPEA